MATLSFQDKPSLLLALAATFPSAERHLPEGWQYRRDIGVWVDADDHSCLMIAGGKPNPGPGPNSPVAPKPKPRPSSKKFDEETGEDMKGQ